MPDGWAAGSFARRVILLNGREAAVAYPSSIVTTCASCWSERID
jgi:hypothetical protein